MASKQFDLCDDAPNVPPQSGGTDSLGFELRELNLGQNKGVQLLILNCGNKRLILLPTRGMGIWQAEHAGVRFGWNSPVAGPIHPMYVPIDEPGGLGWLDGFDELSVRCGLASNGAPEFDSQGRLVWPLHGRIANLPASEISVSIDEDAGKITATGIVHEHRFHFHRWQLKSRISMQLDSEAIEIQDTVTNCSDRQSSFQMLYHNNFGPPLLEDGAKFFAPAKRIAPRNAHAAKGIANWNKLGPPDGRFAEEVYFFELASDAEHRSLVLLTNSDQSLGASIRYQSEHLPCFTLWKNTVGLNDGYVCGLEPGTNFPNPRSFEEQHGRVVNLAPGNSAELEFSIGMHVDPASVSQKIEEITAISGSQPEIHLEPLSDWSAPD